SLVTSLSPPFLDLATINPSSASPTSALHRHHHHHQQQPFFDSSPPSNPLHRQSLNSATIRPSSSIPTIHLKPVLNPSSTADIAKTPTSALHQHHCHPPFFASTGPQVRHHPSFFGSSTGPQVRHHPPAALRRIVRSVEHPPFFASTGPQLRHHPPAALRWIVRSVEHPLFFASTGPQLRHHPPAALRRIVRSVEHPPFFASTGPQLRHHPPAALRRIVRSAEHPQPSSQPWLWHRSTGSGRDWKGVSKVEASTSLVVLRQPLAAQLSSSRRQE
ncbi:hypothetical protein CF326_g9864, partial [Tilletia indica]